MLYCCKKTHDLGIAYKRRHLIENLFTISKGKSMAFTKGSTAAGR